VFFDKAIGDEMEIQTLTVNRRQRFLLTVRYRTIQKNTLLVGNLRKTRIRAR